MTTEGVRDAQGLASGVVRLSAYVAVLGLIGAGGATGWRARAAVAEPFCKLTLGAPMAAAEASNSGVLQLRDGRRIQLAGIEPISAGGAKRLAAMIGKSAIRWARADAAAQTGLIRSQVFLATGEWVQGELVSEGLARVRTWPDHRECAKALLTREAAARTAKRGIWADGAFAIRTPETSGDGGSAYRLVEGRIANVADIRGRIFLNFGDDFRSDFTIHVPPEQSPAFAVAGLDLASLKGRRVRVRGVVTQRNGPAITASVPEQIEILD